MSLTETQASQKSGSPVELYTVSYSFKRWYYTSADDPYTDDIGNVYAAIKISRDNIIASTNDLDRDHRFNFSLSAEFLNLFKKDPPTGVVTLTCQEVHRLDADTEIGLVFKGVIDDVRFGETDAEVFCISTAKYLKGQGLRINYQYNCTNYHYDAYCGLNRDDFVDNGTVVSISGKMLTCSGLNGSTDNLYAAGYIEYTHATLGTVEQVGVVQSAIDGSLVLFSRAPGLSVGTAVKAYWGCDRSLSMCRNRYGNVENFFGEPDMPQQDPFGSDPIY